MYYLDHIGIAVPNLQSAIDDYRSKCNVILDLAETIEDQKVEIAFLKLENTLIELLAPLNNDGPIAKFLSKRGPGLHHLCYRVDDIRAEMKRLESLGCRLIDKEPRKGAHNSQIAFIHPESMNGVLTELCQRERHANIL